MRRGMFGVNGSGDTSGYGRLVREVTLPGSSPRPYGGYFDEVVDTLTEALGETAFDGGDRAGRGVPRRADPGRAPRASARGRAGAARRPGLRFELCLGVNGVHYPDDTGRELHAVYPLMSITHNRRVRLEVACAGRRSAYAVAVFGVPDHRLARARDLRLLRDHLRRPPALTRIEMPDDWVGHPQRKDYPLGGVPVEYKGAADPPARRAEGLQLMSTPINPPENGVPTPSSWPAARTGTRSSRRPRRRRRRRAHRGQHGPAAPVHARRAAADPGDRGRDRHRSPLRHRLPAHRDREEPRVPQLDAGRHLRDPDGLPVAVLQRDRLLPRRGEAARHHRRDPGARQRHPGDADGAQPDLLAIWSRWPPAAWNWVRCRRCSSASGNAR